MTEWFMETLIVDLEVDPGRRSPYSKYVYDTLLIRRLDIKDHNMMVFIIVWYYVHTCIMIGE